MRDSRFYKPLLGLVAVLLLTGTSALQTSMNVDREAMQLTRVTPLENAPPALVFTTVALGGFRGIISNVLWMRANQLQQDSKYFEMVQLADWITKLQPRLAQVWRLQAWNMTYNISVKFPDRNDKWNWIMAGVELLRDEGIQYNPHETVLYEELGYFFYHKMGSNSDLAHMDFKVRWAWEWHNLLNWNELRLHDGLALLELPKEGTSVVHVLRTKEGGLHFRAFDADGAMALDKGEGEFTGAETKLAELRGRLELLWGNADIPRQTKGEVISGVGRLAGLKFLNGTGFPDYSGLVNPRNPVFADIERSIREDQKMDVRLMKEVDDKYGPLDWRMPETHAIYWAMDGIRKARTDNLLPLRRIIYQSMQMASRRGKVIENTPMKKLEFSANIKIIPKANASYLEMMEIDPTRKEHISQGHRNFLIRAIRDLYLANQRESALKWFTYGKEVYPDLWYDDVDIDRFVIANIVEDLESMNPNDFRLFIEGYIRQAYYNLVRGEFELYQGHIGMARKVRDKYMYWIKRPEMTEILNRSIPPVEELEDNVLKSYFDPASGTPPEVLAILKTQVPNLEERLGRAKPSEEPDEAAEEGKEKQDGKAGAPAAADAAR